MPIAKAKIFSSLPPFGRRQERNTREIRRKEVCREPWISSQISRNPRNTSETYAF
jgi:hypothetical protein